MWEEQKEEKLYKAYYWYVVAKNHMFVDSYDMYKYKFKIKMDRQSETTRHNLRLFYQISNRSDLITREDFIKFYVSNFVMNGRRYATQMDETVFFKKQSIWETFSENLKKQLDIVLQEYKENPKKISLIQYEERDRPLLYIIHAQETIEVDTLCFFDILMDNQLILRWIDEEKKNEKIEKKKSDHIPLMMRWYKYSRFLSHVINIEMAKEVFNDFNTKFQIIKAERTAKNGTKLLSPV